MINERLSQTDISCFHFSLLLTTPLILVISVVAYYYISQGPEMAFLVMIGGSAGLFLGSLIIAFKKTQLRREILDEDGVETHHIYHMDRERARLYTFKCQGQEFFFVYFDNRVHVVEQTSVSQLSNVQLFRLVNPEERRRYISPLELDAR